MTENNQQTDEHSKEIKFQARIKIGATIGQDHAMGRWPWCLAPGGKDEADDPDMVFEAQYKDGVIDLRAHGFGLHGVKDGYGNGSIYVWDIEDLIVDNKARRKIADIKREKLKVERAELVAKLADVDAKLKTLSRWSVTR